MRFVYNNKEYEVLELYDINGVSRMGMVALFEIQYAHYEHGKRVLDDEEAFLNQNDYEDSPIIFEEMRFVNHFPIDTQSKEEIINTCEYFIDYEYDKQFSEVKFLMAQVKKAWLEFQNDIANGYDTKGSLDKVEYAQSDLTEWILENVKGEEE